MLFRPMLALAAAACLWSSATIAETLYVGPDGRDTWPGTRDQPLASLAFAKGRLPPGTQVVVLEGTYQGPVRIDSAGTEDAPITVSADASGNVILDGSSMEPNTDLVVITGSHVIFEGFEVRNAQRSGISLWGTKRVVVRANSVHGSHGSGIWVGFETRGTSAENLVESNEIFANVQENADRKMTRGWSSGIEVSGSDNTILRRNKSFKNFGEGISVLSSKNILVESNLLYDNYSVNLYLDNAQGVIATGNTAGTSGDDAHYRDGRPALAAAVVDKEAPIILPSAGNTLENNVWVGISGVFVDPLLKKREDVLREGPKPNTSRPGLIRLEP